MFHPLSDSLKLDDYTRNHIFDCVSLVYVLLKTVTFVTSIYQTKE